MPQLDDRPLPQLDANSAASLAGGLRIALGRDGEASRGSLLHAIETDAEGRIARWRVVTPTEWNFRPQGAARSLLGAIPAGLSSAQRQALAQPAVHALDPCVSCELAVDLPA